MSGTKQGCLPTDPAKGQHSSKQFEELHIGFHNRVYRRAACRLEREVETRSICRDFPVGRESDRLCPSRGACPFCAGTRLKRALVTTGEFRSTDLQNAVRPEVVFETIADLPCRWNGIAREKRR